MNRPMTPRLWWALCAVFITMIALTLGNMIYTQRSVREGQRQWCDIVTTLDNAYHAQPPPTPAGKRLAADIHSLRERFHCE